ncbi:metallophosphoesterase [Sulfurisphaera javensis]|uniref:Metallophosphoesterase n=1 Tax=Sulfurisphaera javensis TaxID=2049879 RepID=A0AAT9GSZ4_9CREN
MGLFKRKQPEGVDNKKSQLKILFTSDLHASDVAFRKFLNVGKMIKADVMIIGGDLAGKALIPIIDIGNGKYEVDSTQVGKEGLETVIKQIKANGNYYVIVDKKEYDEMVQDKRKVDEAFKNAIQERLKEWIQLAEERYKDTKIPIYFNLGNDDPMYMFDIVPEESIFKRTEGFIIPIGDLEMISYGYVNPTPWNTYREKNEEEIYKDLKEIMNKVSDPSKVILNTHAPPYGTNLDNAPLLDKNLKPVVKGGDIVMTHVGSQSVRKIIEEYKPLMGVHGHIHESKAFDKVAGTLVFNPGSEYSAGVFHGLYILVEGNKIKAHQFITG